MMAQSVMFALKGGKAEFSSQNPHKHPRHDTLFNLRAGGAGSEGAMGSTHQPV